MRGRHLKNRLYFKLPDPNYKKIFSGYFLEKKWSETFKNLICLSKEDGDVQSHNQGRRERLRMRLHIGYTNGSR